MKGDKRSVELLNDLLTAELTAINQYFLHAKMCENWGYGKLAAKIREVSFEEMRDAEEIISRILFFDAVPNLQRLAAVKIGETVREIFELQLEMEHVVLEILNKAVPECAANGDHASREYFAAKLIEEEGHVDWLETQLSVLDKVGEQNYLASQI